MKKILAFLFALLILSGCGPANPIITPAPTVISNTSMPTAMLQPTASPSPAPDEFGKIAYASDIDGDFDIWLVNADGSNPRQLTENTVMDGSPAWSPDGSRIVFVSNRDGNNEIYSMKADGSEVRRLTNTPDASESFPAWSPDGLSISFDANHSSNWDIYVMSSDGSNLRRLTDHPGEDWLSSWSPDGQQIAFESKRDGNYEIYVMNADGSDQRRLTQNTIHDGAPKWSPDGSKIAFFSQRDGNLEIYTMDTDGGNPKRLTDQAGDDSFPSWSPDGLKIIFSSGQNGHDEIYIMNADGSQVRQLTGNRAQNWSPAWRPLPTDFLTESPSSAPTEIIVGPDTPTASVTDTAIPPVPRTDCAQRYATEPAKRAYWPTAEWQVSTLEEHCLDPQKIAKAAWYFENNHSTSSLLIVRHGELVYERYFLRHVKPERRLPIFSITKSILSALYGTAIDQGLLDSLDHKVIEYFPEYFYAQTDPRMSQVTLRNLLTMSAGYLWLEDGEIEERWTESDNLVEASINLKFTNSPGEVFTYSSANTQLLSAILTQITGQRLRDYAQQHLFSPLGIAANQWDWAVDNQGYAIGGYGINLKARDLARFGYLYLNQGYWDGKQLISSDWVQQSTTSQFDTGGGLDYGYLWWVHPRDDESVFEARGYGGQSLYVVPSLDLVIVATGDVRTGDITGAPDPSPIIYEWIVKAVTDAP